MRILIVEADKGTREWLNEYISSWGFDVVLSEDGEAAWEILSKPNAPQMVLCNCLIPKINGNELCKKLSSNNQNNHSYFIMLISKLETSNMMSILDSGADDYIYTPIEPLEVKSKLIAGKRIIDL